MPKTKIVCTIGPASKSPEVLKQLIIRGMNVARLNFSHGTQEDHLITIENIRSIANRLGQPVAILQDIAGPKIRIGEIKKGSVILKTGDFFILTTRKITGNEKEVFVNYINLPKDVKPGDRLLLSDGALELEVIETTGQDIKCRVIIGGPLSSKKGINLTTGSLNVPILTEKDKNDLTFGLKHEVDYVALSFVRTTEDVIEVKRFMEEQGDIIPIIAKIEKHEALNNIDEIIREVDGVMVARGDLGVEIPLEQVPMVQKMLIEKSNRAGKPTITATQMLLSMVNNPRPTRAEVTDIANAILDGTGAVMLSEETAAGKYPVQAVEMMVRVADDTEKGFPYGIWINRLGIKNLKNEPEAVSLAARNLAENIDAISIISFTQSGSTARIISKYRPRQAIVAVTPHDKTYRRMALIWGVTPIISEKAINTTDMLDKAHAAVLKSGLFKADEAVVITAGIPVGEFGNTNLIHSTVL